MSQKKKNKNISSNKKEMKDKVNAQNETKENTAPKKTKKFLTSLLVALLMSGIYAILLWLIPSILPKLSENSMHNAIYGITATFFLFFISTVLFLKYKEVYSRVLVGLVSGVLFGLLFGETCTSYIAPVGEIFLRLIQLLVVPLVFSSLCLGVLSLGDIKKIGRIGGKTILYYVLTTMFAIAIGLTLGNIIKPGNWINDEVKETYLQKYQETVANKTNTSPEKKLALTIGESIYKSSPLSPEEQEKSFNAYQDSLKDKLKGKVNKAPSIGEMIVNIIPKNPGKAIVETDMLQIIFIALVFGLLLAHISKDKKDVIEKGLSGVSDAMIVFVGWIMYLAPWGVFALMSKIVSQVGASVLKALFMYMAVVILGLALQITIVYGAVARLAGKMSLFTFLKKIKSVILWSFSTSSSCATIPVSMQCVEKEFNVSPTISSFVIPLGATINMNGTALYQGVATLFIAQVYGIPLDIWGQLTIIITATLSAIGTAGVPAVGIIILAMVLNSVHVPLEGIAIIIGVDRVLDMCRTVVNVMGDLSATIVVQATEKTSNE